MIMKTIYLKIGLVLILTLIATVAIKVFWSSETAPVAEPKETEQAQKEVKVDPVVEPKTQQPVVKPVSEPPRPGGPQIPEEERLYPEAEKLYQMALSLMERENPSDMDFRITADCCRKILADYPDSPEADNSGRNQLRGLLVF